MFKKIMWLLSIVAVLSFVSCGGDSTSSSPEAKKLMTKLLNFVGIPTNIIVAVCIDKDKNGICASSEIQAKVTLNQGESFDDIWKKLALNEDGKYLLEVYDEKLPILIEIQDEAKVDFDDGKFTLNFDGFKTKENNEEKEISILQSMVDADAISINEADTFRTLINKEAQSKFYITLLNDLETNLNTLRLKGLDNKTATSSTIKEMADEIKSNQAKANRINICGDNQTCVEREIKSLSDELIITEEESNAIVNLGFNQQYILGKTLYMVRAESNDYFTVKYNTSFGTREIGTEGNMKSQEYIINEKGEIIVNDNDVVIKLIAHYETYDHIQVSLPKLNKIYENQRAYFNEKDAKTYFLSINNNNGQSIKNCSSDGLIKLDGLKKYYTEGEIVTFNIDTLDTTGYLYVFVVDNIETTRLEPLSSESSAIKVKGKYTFPNDFSSIVLRTSKNCINCEEEKTTIYTLITKEATTNVKELLTKQIEKPCWSQIDNQSTPLVNIGKIDFFVK